ncbi:hypothetical protein [Mycobacterium sp. CnD-18-1]|uniref:hypothetical protein n=1 Tax=Mycobacterium sp. CnD-18-1 TaxID=2917744 RepID=UPI001EF1BA9D|nr:hypothetical protein [Mycobacterium sp. CnD-18-1]MCG7607142.1 hypothetical protein [Mycobacterium sp. CnD-18-1]
MTTYYVLHSGVGRDGGFGDYAGVYWSDEPVKIDGKTVWFETETEAKSAVDRLNKSAESVHRYVQYSGDFPAEYEYRRIDTPGCPPADGDMATWLIAEQDQEWWPRGYGCEYDDECNYCGGDCVDECDSVED